MQTLPPNLEPLREHLTPAQIAGLAAGGELPRAERARLGSELRARLEACAAYVPARLVRAQLADPRPGRTGGAFWEGSLLFADLSGFTALSARLSVLGRQGAEEVSTVVNQLFAALIAEVQARQGALLKFGGDALTAFFDAELLGGSHAAAATAAALAMQERMAAFADMQTRAGTFSLSLRVGVHSGRVFAAEVGDASHVELVVTGPEVNRVAMAQEIAAPGEVVVSQRTAGLLAGAGLEPREAGFLRVTALADAELPDSPPDPLASTGPVDIASLARMAAQLAGLRPYLVRGLPRRFLELADAGLGEFRPVTVLFANFADFSAILTGLGEDAATAAAVLNAYYRRAQAVVHRYDGIVNKVDMYTHGDKLMALFGAPTAHEDDPTRAVRCALELEQALEEANQEIAELLGRRPLTMDDGRGAGDGSSRPADSGRNATAHGPWSAALTQRVGINTGTVFAGRVGGQTRYEYTVMGSAVNLAARLMSAAPEGATLLSPSTRASVGGQFALAAGAPLQLKGLSEPVVPARLIGLSTGASSNQGDELLIEPAPLIGRAPELSGLRDAARAALRGHGRALAVIGEAGAGKTRLCEELLQALVMDSIDSSNRGVPAFHMVFGDCQGYEQRTPYAAVRAPLRELCGISAANLAPAEAAAFAHERVRQLAPRLERFAPLLGDALGLSLGESALTSALSPQQRHDRLQELIVALFQGAALVEPLLVMIEDLHWSDSPSLELLGRVAAAAAELPLLLLLNYRPDPPISAPWDELPATVQVRLGELSPADSADLLAALLGGPPPPDILPLLERTQGNPYFIEELVRALIAEQVLVRGPAGWSLSRPIDQVELPKSIEGLLIARLDRLDEPRQNLVQVASVIGRRFQRPVVEGVYADPDPLDESLQRLIQIELIQAEHFERALAYLFRHAMLRDVAYQGILFARRRVLHGRVARRIEELSGDQIDEQLALLAWHYLAAEEWEPALAYHMRAGAQAQRRFANREALALYQSALEIIGHMGGPQARPALAEQAGELHERIGDLYLLLGEYDDAERAYQQVLQGLDHLPAAAAAGAYLRICRAIAAVFERRSDYEAAFGWIERGLARTTRATRPEQARCYLLGAGIYQRQGQYERSLEWANLGLAIAEELQSPRDQAEALILLGGTYRNMGDNLRAFELMGRCVGLLTQSQDLGRLADAHNNLAVICQMLGRYQEAREQFAAGAAIKEEIGDIYGQALIANNLGELLRQQGDLEAAAQQYARSLAIFTRLRSNYASGVLNMNLGATYLMQGSLEAAEAHLARSGELFAQVGAEDFLPELERYRSELLLRRGDLDGAHAACQSSLSHAARLNARSEEGVSRRLLGEILAAEGRPAAAWQELRRSLDLLLEADSPYEVARTRLSLADLAHAAGEAPAGRDALAAARASLERLGAARELERAAAIALRYA